MPIHVHTYVPGNVFDNKFVTLDITTYPYEREREREREGGRERERKKGRERELKDRKLNR